MVVNLPQELNIILISVTFAVLKEERSRVMSDSQPVNIPLIFVTSAVLNPVKSIDASDAQSLNTRHMLVTLLVSKPTPNVMFVNAVHPLNILSMLVTLLV